MGEREKDMAILKRSAQRLLGRPLEVFIPAVTQKFLAEQETTFYVEGYVFVHFQEGVNYLRLQDTTYFSSVLTQSFSSSRRPEFSFLQDKDLDKIRAGMKTLAQSGLEIGDKVKLTAGPYKNLSGNISLVYEGGEKVQVAIPLSSKPVLMDVPSSMLVKMQNEEP